MLTQTLSRSHSVVAFLDILPGSYANWTTQVCHWNNCSCAAKLQKRQVNREKYCD